MGKLLVEACFLSCFSVDLLTLKSAFRPMATYRLCDHLRVEFRLRRECRDQSTQLDLDTELSKPSLRVLMPHPRVEQLC